MPDVSAAILVLAGAILACGGLVNTSLTADSRTRVIGIGLLLSALGTVSWVVAYWIFIARLKP